MSKIQEMIDRMCPDGVKYKSVESVCDVISAPKKLDKKYYSNSGSYPIIDQGQKFIIAYTEDSSALLPKDEYIIFGEHTREVKYVDFPFCQGADGLKILKAKSSICPKYLYYAISNLDIPSRGYNRHWTVLRPLEIPIPPLPVQEEIVRVLDTFTELQAELQAELQKRLQQYNYYRDNLLSFEGRTDVEWVTIDHLFHRKNGYTPSKANPDFWRNGTIPWFRMEDIRENGRVLTDSIQKVHSSAVKRNSLVKAGSIILATSATIGEHALANVDCLTNQRFTCLTIKEEHKHRADIKFLFYYMFKVDEWCKTHTVQGNFPGVDMSQFPYVFIPLPPLNEQKKIASALDRFDALTRDLTAGLPAEIEKRRQQYEYYRDQLLTFKRAN